MCVRWVRLLVFHLVGSLNFGSISVLFFSSATAYLFLCKICNEFPSSMCIFSVAIFPVAANTGNLLIAACMDTAGWTWIGHDATFLTFFFFEKLYLQKIKNFKIKNKENKIYDGRGNSLRNKVRGWVGLYFPNAPLFPLFLFLFFFFEFPPGLKVCLLSSI